MRIHRFVPPLIAFSLSILFVASCSAEISPSFWSKWGDGQAELSGYRLSQPRYGQMHEGEAVLIFVTENFSKKVQVKVDRSLPDSEKLPVLKLNHARRFKTGIYDYAMMISVFSPVQPWSLGELSLPATTPVKISLSSTEWCGNHYEQINRRAEGFVWDRHSYFDGEADTQSVLPDRKQSFFEDDLLLRVRELLEPFPAGKYTALTSTLYGRFTHRDPRWESATVLRNVLDAQRTTVIGDTSVVEYTVSIAGRRYTISVENGPQRRILGWEVIYGSGAGALTEKAVLTGTMRNPYWKHNRLGDEKLREKLGLSSQ